MSMSHDLDRGSGKKPAIWQVPHLRNSYFSGREDELAELRKNLLSQDPKRHVQAVWGLAGVGKTQVALEYVYRFGESYNIVWWVGAEEPSNLALTYARLATRLGMDVPEGTPLEDIRQALRRALNERDDWLIVFDNAASVEELRPYLPQEKSGHVIITSRNPNWDAVARPFALRPMKRDESVELLLKRTGKKKVDGAVGALAQALGDLPLALDQAAACISNARTDFGGYLREFEHYWGELLRDVRPTGDYPDSVHMTWELACRQLQEESQVGYSLMSLLAYLGSDAVPRELLRGAEGLPDGLSVLLANEHMLEEAIAALAKYSL
ncbi:MAG TPA: ATP-binding protein, partial [Tepidisphaeraceae bacterium]